MVVKYGYIIDHTSELQCMVADVRSDGHLRGCFSGCLCADKLVRLFNPTCVECSIRTKNAKPSKPKALLVLFPLNGKTFDWLKLLIIEVVPNRTRPV